MKNKQDFPITFQSNFHKKNKLTLKKKTADYLLNKIYLCSYTLTLIILATLTYLLESNNRKTTQISIRVNIVGCITKFKRLWRHLEL